MAGYIIYSLDWKKFSALIERPTPEQLGILARMVGEELGDLDGEFEEGDPVLSWPQDPEALSRLIAQRLAQPDWYGDLSEVGKNLWEGTMFSACMNSEELGLGLDFRVDSDGIYWDLIELAREHYNVPPNAVNEVALSAFGLQPFRYVPVPPSAAPWEDWHPMHSMHTPDVVQRMQQEFLNLASVVEEADEDVQQQYNEELMPALEAIVNDGRLLFIQVDT